MEKCEICNKIIIFGTPAIQIIILKNVMQKKKYLFHNKCFYKNFILRDMKGEKNICVCNKKVSLYDHFIRIYHGHIRTSSFIHTHFLRRIHFDCFKKYWMINYCQLDDN